MACSSNDKIRPWQTGFELLVLSVLEGMPISLLLVILNQWQRWKNRVIFPGIHNVMNPKRLFGCLANSDGPLITSSLSDIYHLGALLEPSPSSFLTDEEDEETKTTPLWGPLGVKAPA